MKTAGAGTILPSIDIVDADLEIMLPGKAVSSADSETSPEVVAIVECCATPFTFERVLYDTRTVCVSAMTSDWPTGFVALRAVINPPPWVTGMSLTEKDTLTEPSVPDTASW